jgi:hypothetical protein
MPENTTREQRYHTLGGESTQKAYRRNLYIMIIAAAGMVASILIARQCPPQDEAALMTAHEKAIATALHTAVPRLTFFTEVTESEGGTIYNISAIALQGEAARENYQDAILKVLYQELRGSKGEITIRYYRKTGQGDNLAFSGIYRTSISDIMNKSEEQKEDAGENY